MITGSVYLDLTSVAAERQRHRLTALSGTPSGARVIVYVGALAVEPQSVRLLGEHTDRIHIEVQGQPDAVRRWVAALNEAAEGLISA